MKYQYPRVLGRVIFLAVFKLDSTLKMVAFNKEFQALKSNKNAAKLMMLMMLDPNSLVSSKKVSDST